MNYKPKWILSTFVFSFLMLLSLYFLNSIHDEGLLASEHKSYGKPQKGYIMQKDDVNKGILVVSDVSESELKKLKIDWSNMDRNMMSYSIENRNTFNKLEVGKKVTIYNNGSILQSNPGQTTATKILIEGGILNDL